MGNDLPCRFAPQTPQSTWARAVSLMVPAEQLAQVAVLLTSQHAKHLSMGSPGLLNIWQLTWFQGLPSLNGPEAFLNTMIWQVIWQLIRPSGS